MAADPAGADGEAGSVDLPPAPDSVSEAARLLAAEEAAWAARVITPSDNLPDGVDPSNPYYLDEDDRAVLAERMSRVLEAHPFDQMQWGLYVRDMHDGRIIFEANAKKKFVPASNQKVLTTAAALTALGPDYRYRTPLFALGSVSGGTLTGSLVLVGSGDPTWSGRFHSSWRAPIDRLADALLAQGIREVTGPLVLDVSRWDSTTVEGTWMIDDLPWSWGASGGAFVVNDGTVRVVVRGGDRNGDAAVVATDPALGRDRFRSNVVTAPVDSIVMRPSYRDLDRRIDLEGAIPRNRDYAERIAMRDPVRTSGELLMGVLRQRGIRVAGGVGYAWDPESDLGHGCAAGRVESCPGAREVVTIESPPLSTISRAILEPSQNWIADQVLRTLGAELGTRGGWVEGLRAAEEQLGREFGVLGPDLDMHDGSGLSAYNLVTPRAMTQVLYRMRILPFADAYMNALASPGEDDSTMRGRLLDLRGRLFAKTGTIHHVNSLSGYLVRNNGRELVFAILTNASGLESRDVRLAIDRIVRELARW